MLIYQGVLGTFQPLPATGRGVEHLSYAWMWDEWSYEAPQVVVEERLL
jgi:hypothetical protein